MLNITHRDHMGNRRVTLTPTVDLANKIHAFNHFQIDDVSVVVCLLWDLGEKEPFAAES